MTPPEPIRPYLVEQHAAAGLGHAVVAAMYVEGSGSNDINGMTKPTAELFSDSEYRKNVRDIGDEHKSNFPRRIAEP